MPISIHKGVTSTAEAITVLHLDRSYREERWLLVSALKSSGHSGRNKSKYSPRSPCQLHMEMLTCVCHEPHAPTAQSTTTASSVKAIARKNNIFFLFFFNFSNDSSCSCTRRCLSCQLGKGELGFQLLTYGATVTARCRLLDRPGRRGAISDFNPRCGFASMSLIFYHLVSARTRRSPTVEIPSQPQMPMHGLECTSNPSCSDHFH